MKADKFHMSSKLTTRYERWAMGGLCYYMLHTGGAQRWFLTTQKYIQDEQTEVLYTCLQLTRIDRYF